MKAIIATSFICSSIIYITNTYKCSQTCTCLRTLAGWCAKSGIAKAFKRFGEKRPTYWNSCYQQTLNRISAGISVFSGRLNTFFSRIMRGSTVCRAYTEFVRNKGENRLRAVGVFGFYFFIAASMLGISGIIGRGRSAACFVLALVFFAFAYFAEKFAAAFESSFFVKLIMGLIK